MKKSWVLAAALTLPMSTAWADNDVGCGLGTQIWQGQSGLIFKVLAATTNGIFGNQTFGITTGTLGCSADGVITAANELPVFAGANIDQLAVEMAAGQGETLDALADLYEVAAADRAAFNSLARDNFATVFTADTATAGEVLARFNAVLADSELKGYAKV